MNLWQLFREAMRQQDFLVAADMLLDLKEDHFAQLVREIPNSISDYDSVTVHTVTHFREVLCTIDGQARMLRDNEDLTINIIANSYYIGVDASVWSCRQGQWTHTWVREIDIESIRYYGITDIYEAIITANSFSVPRDCKTQFVSPSGINQPRYALQENCHHVWIPTEPIEYLQGMVLISVLSTINRRPQIVENVFDPIIEWNRYYRLLAEYAIPSMSQALHTLIQYGHCFFSEDEWRILQSCFNPARIIVTRF